jgi:hypothetical protein
MPSSRRSRRPSSKTPIIPNPSPLGAGRRELYVGTPAQAKTPSPIFMGEGLGNEGFPPLIGVTIHPSSVLSG